MIILKVLAGRAKDLLDAAGVLRRHEGALDLTYVEKTIQSICELAQDVDAWNRLLHVLGRDAPGG